MRKAIQTLLYKQHAMPGVKGWELRRSIGKDYVKVLEALNLRLEELGLIVRIVFEGSDKPENPNVEVFDSARYYVTLSEPMTPTDLKMSGWRIDNIAALAVTAAYLLSRQGKSSRKEIESVLRQKFPQWKLDYNLSRFIRQGYLTEDDEGMLYLGWRSRAEIDAKQLLNLVLNKEPSDSGDDTSAGQ